MERVQLATWIDQGLSLDAIAGRVGRHPSTVSYWINKHGLRAGKAEVHGPKGGIDRERLVELIDRELSIREIAEELGVSYSNVRYWIAQYELADAGKVRRAKMRAARERGDAHMHLRCKRHGQTRHHWHHVSYRCSKCRSETVVRRRRKVKRQLVEEFGGRCALCGYDRLPRALHFHHLNPNDKAFAVSGAGTTIGIEKIRAEANKCVLLCSNCHAEVEGGAVTLPVE